MIGVVLYSFPFDFHLELNWLAYVITLRVVLYVICQPEISRLGRLYHLDLSLGKALVRYPTHLSVELCFMKNWMTCTYCLRCVLLSFFIYGFYISVQA
jgi:hypothetical protein